MEIYFNPANGHQQDRGNEPRAYQRQRIKKLANQREASRPQTSENGGPLLRGVKAYLTGPDIRDLDLKELIVRHGGQVVITGVTHVICVQMASAKFKNIQKSPTPIHVVRPTWVLDSVEAEKRQPESAYSIGSDHAAAQPSVKQFFAFAK